MKIISLQADNVKRLRAIHIEPGGNPAVEIAGRNGQGKTSVLDSIVYALGGGRAQAARPIRDGEHGARVILDLGELIVTRTWTAEGKTTLTVKAADGSKFTSPQSVLDKLVGSLSFDPLAFSMLPEKEQVAALLALVDLPFVPAELARKRSKLYDDRTEVGRAVTNRKGQIASMGEPFKDVPDTEVSPMDIVKEIRAIEDAHREHDRLINAERFTNDQVEDAITNVQRAEDALVAARAAYDEAQARYNLARANRVAHILPDGAEDLEARLANVEETNRQVRHNAQLIEFGAWLLADQSKVDSLTAAIAELDQYKADTLATAAMPVPGLGFDDYGVTLNGVPFRQCSSAEQLRVSMAIALSANPELRIVLIKDGSLLDSQSLALVAEMAAQRDAQVWIERVDESGTVGIVIEDGEVVSTPASRLAS